MDSEKMNLSHNLKVLLILCTLQYMYSDWQLSKFFTTFDNTIFKYLLFLDSTKHKFVWKKITTFFSEAFKSYYDLFQVN